MKLISSVKIERFRSIAEADLDEFGNFTALAGLNNSGKSYVLRALNAFFSGHGDPGRPISIESDYHRQYLKRKKAKKIRVAVRFSLPNQFTFRRGLEPVREFLGSMTFEVEKEWNRQSASPDYFLNGGEALDANQRAKIDQFLSLISFRYIPNRVLPLDVIRNDDGVDSRTPFTPGQASCTSWASRSTKLIDWSLPSGTNSSPATWRSTILPKGLASRAF